MLHALMSGTRQLRVIVPVVVVFWTLGTHQLTSSARHWTAQSSPGLHLMMVAVDTICSTQLGGCHGCYWVSGWGSCRSIVCMPSVFGVFNINRSRLILRRRTRSCSCRMCMTRCLSPVSRVWLWIPFMMVDAVGPGWESTKASGTHSCPIDSAHHGLLEVPLRLLQPLVHIKRQWACRRVVYHLAGTVGSGPFGWTGFQSCESPLIFLLKLQASGR